MLGSAMAATTPIMGMTISTAHSFALAQTQPLELVEQVPLADTQEFGRPAAIAPCGGQRFLDGRPLGSLDNVLQPGRSPMGARMRSPSNPAGAGQARASARGGAKHAVG